MTLRCSLPHRAIVYEATFTRDSTGVVTAGADGTVRFWDATTGRLIQSFRQPRPNGEVVRYFALAVSPAGTQVAAIDATGSVVHVWDMHSGALLQELVDDSPPPNMPLLEFSNDGGWLAASAGDGVRVHETTTWKRVLLIPGPGIDTLSFDPTGPRLATATSRGDVSIWAIPSGARSGHLREGGDQVRHVAFSPDGSLVVAAGQDGTDRIWNAHSGELQVELKDHHNEIAWAEFDPTSRFVVSGSVDGAVAISDVSLRMTVSTLGGPSGRIRTVHFDPRAQRVIAASWDGTARIWDATASYLRWATRSLGRDCASTVRPESDRRFIAIACSKHGTGVWDTQDPDGPRLLAQLPSPTPVPGDFLSPYPAVDAAGDRAAVAIGNTVKIFELPGGRVVDTVQHSAPVTSVAFAASGHDLATGSVDGAVRITRDSGSFMLAELPAAVDVVGFLPDGRAIAADNRARLHVYDVTHRASVAELELPGRITAFRSSSDGRRLLTIPTTGVARPPVLWNLDSYERVTALEAEHGPVFSARFIQGDSEILTASTDGTTRVWDAATGHFRKSYFRSSPYLIDAALDPTGTIVVTAGGDGVLRFWDTSSGHMIWSLKAHQSAIGGIHFEGADLVTRAFDGEIARWKLPAPPSSELNLTIDRIVRCLPLRFDDETRGLVEQDRRCDTR
jgi:WD40 repeat protein